jgi:hypothetical protein
MDQVRLVAITPSQRQARPVHGRTGADLSQHVLEASKSAIELGCEPNLLSEQLSKATAAHAGFPRHRENAPDW